MARAFTLVLTTFTLLALAACGGDDDSGSATPSGGEQASVSGSDGGQTPDSGWQAELSGHLTGQLANKLNPQCIVSDGPLYSIILQGSLDGQTVVVTVLSGGPGSFDLQHPADEAPRIGVATSGQDPNEWLVTAGENTVGELTIEDDASGNVTVTLPPITAGDVGRLTVTASWTCPAQ